MSLSCWIYRSSKKDEMYLYLAREDDFECMPELLMRRFGASTLVMTLELHDQRSLARAEVREVMQQLGETGYY